MNDFRARLRDCFPEYPIPSDILVERNQADCDSAEASLLLGVSWTRVAFDFWRDHWSAASALNPSSYVYYLPSMLEFSLDDSFELIRESLIYNFDTSGNPDLFPILLSQKMEFLNLSQIKCLIDWAGIMKEMHYFSDEIEEERVYITLMIYEEMKSRYA